MKTFYYKFKSENEHKCMMCANYLKCKRIRAGDCFSVHKELLVDLLLLFPDYFTTRKTDAIKLLEDK